MNQAKVQEQVAKSGKRQSKIHSQKNLQCLAILRRPQFFCELGQQKIARQGKTRWILNWAATLSKKLQ